MAQEERGHAARHPDRRGLRLGGHAPYGGRELPDEAALGEPRVGPSTVRGAVSTERDGARSSFFARAAEPVPAETPGTDQSANAVRRPKELLDLHEHTDRQRTG